MTNNKRVILGIIGEMASGKTTVTDYLKENHGAVTFRFSDILRDLLDRLYLIHSREHMQRLSTVLRQEFGDDLFSNVIAKDVADATAPLIIAEGIRRPSDVIFLRQIPGFYLLALTADEQTRYDRLIARTENPDDQKKTWEQFQADGRQEAEQEIKTIAAQADFVADNSGTKEDLFREIDGIIQKTESQKSIQSG